MDQTSLGLLIAFIAVAVVLASVWAMAHFGARAAFSQPNPKLVRRFARVLFVVAAAQLVFAVVLAVFGDLGRAAMYGVGGVVILWNAVSMLRELERAGARSDSVPPAPK